MTERTASEETPWHALTGLSVMICYCEDGQHRHQHMFAAPSVEIRDHIIADHTLARKADALVAERARLDAQSQRTWDERDVYLRHLRNLLARIHRDGGHYVEEHGLEKAVEDAHQVWADLRIESEKADALVKALEEQGHLDGCAEASMHYKESCLGQERWECGNCRASSWRHAARVEEQTQ